MVITLKGHKSFGPLVEGEALVANDAIMFNADFHMGTGVCVTRGHELFGKKVAGKIVVMRAQKGGCATSVGIQQLVEAGHGPKALILEKASPNIVEGAIVAGIPIMDRFDRSPIEVIETGDHIKIDPGRGILTITKKK